MSLICQQPDCCFFCNTVLKVEVTLCHLQWVSPPPFKIIKCDARDKLFLETEELWSF